MPLPVGRVATGHLGVQTGGKRIVRVSDTGSSPGDDFCALWHVFDLLPGGPAGWQPRFRYGGARRPR
jgi:hypothetical protein